jgi:hypothetical protein
VVWQWVSRPLPSVHPRHPSLRHQPSLARPTSPRPSLPDSKVVNAFVLYVTCARARSSYMPTKGPGFDSQSGNFLVFYFYFLLFCGQGLMGWKRAAFFFSPPSPRPHQPTRRQASHQPTRRQASCSESAIHRRSCFGFVLHSLAPVRALSLTKRKTLHTHTLTRRPGPHPPTHPGSRPRNGARDAPLASTPALTPHEHTHTHTTHTKTP